MSPHRIPLVVLVGVTAFSVPGAPAEKLDKGDKKWLEDVAPIILRDEKETFSSLTDKGDREEFQRIFWARRNPDGPTAVQNPAKVEYDRVRSEIEKRYRVATRLAVTTDCARVFALLGEPADVRRDIPLSTPDTAASASTGLRVPEVWTFKDRPGRTFVGGQIQVPFDVECHIPDGGKFIAQIERLAEARIVNPNIGYKKAAGHLIKLVDQLPKPSPVQTLLKEPRQDFPVVTERKLTMRTQDGAVYVGGLLRVDPGALTVQEESGTKKVSVMVAAQAVDETGKVVPTPEQETVAALGPDGRFVGSFGLTLKPGKYTLKAVVFDAKANKGSVVSSALEVPDYAGPEIAMSEPLILSDVQEGAASDPKNPLASFLMGNLQLVPRFGNVFSPSDSIQIVAFVYNGQLDPATGKPRFGCSFVILRDGKPVTQASEEQVIEEPAGTPGVGPIPLTKFSAATYTVRLKVNDKVAKKDFTKEATFEVKP